MVDFVKRFRDRFGILQRDRKRRFGSAVQECGEAVVNTNVKDKMWEILLKSLEIRREYVFLICYTQEGQYPSKTVKSAVQNVIYAKRLEKLRCERGYPYGVYHTHPNKRELIAPSFADVKSFFRWIGSPSYTTVVDIFIGGVRRAPVEGVIYDYRVTDRMKDAGNDYLMLLQEYERAYEEWEKTGSESAKQDAFMVHDELQRKERKLKELYNDWIQSPFCLVKEDDLSEIEPWWEQEKEKQPWWRRIFT